ncbi:MAG: TlpA family protein disulfide reductase [Chloroflexi bacterium]|nr:TlpA family protein disulfide reductase [Chloroflexota bacterium]
MNTKRVILLGAILMTFALAACSAPAAPADSTMKKESPTADAAMKKESPTADAMMKKESPTADAMMKKESPTVDAAMKKDTMATPAWFSANLTDVNTGKSFQVADFKGKVVLVETMAVWCSTCLQQQKQVQALHQLVKRDDLVSIALSIDANENDATLKAYAAKNNFDWKYAVAPAVVSREIGNLYGAQFLNPPSAPMFVIDRAGKVHPLPFGVKSAQDLKTAVEMYLKAGM